MYPSRSSRDKQQSNDDQIPSVVTYPGLYYKSSKSSSSTSQEQNIFSAPILPQNLVQYPSKFIPGSVPRPGIEHSSGNSMLADSYERIRHEARALHENTHHSLKCNSRSPIKETQTRKSWNMSGGDEFKEKTHDHMVQSTSPMPSAPPPPTFDDHSSKGQEDTLSKLLDNRQVSLSSLLEAAMDPSVGSNKRTEDPIMKKTILDRCEGKIAQLYRHRICGIGTFFPLMQARSTKTNNNISPLTFHHPRIEFNMSVLEEIWTCPDIKVESKKQESLRPIKIYPDSKISASSDGTDDVGSLIQSTQAIQVLGKKHPIESLPPANIETLNCNIFEPPPGFSVPPTIPPPVPPPVPPLVPHLNSNYMFDTLPAHSIKDKLMGTKDERRETLYPSDDDLMEWRRIRERAKQFEHRREKSREKSDKKKKKKRRYSRSRSRSKQRTRKRTCRSRTRSRSYSPPISSRSRGRSPLSRGNDHYPNMPIPSIDRPPVDGWPNVEGNLTLNSWGLKPPCTDVSYGPSTSFNEYYNQSQHDQYMTSPPSGLNHPFGFNPPPFDFHYAPPQTRYPPSMIHGDHQSFFPRWPCSGPMDAHRMPTSAPNMSPHRMATPSMSVPNTKHGSRSNLVDVLKANRTNTLPRVGNTPRSSTKPATEVIVIDDDDRSYKRLKPALVEDHPPGVSPPGQSPEREFSKKRQPVASNKNYEFSNPMKNEFCKSLAPLEKVVEVIRNDQRACFEYKTLIKGLEAGSYEFDGMYTLLEGLLCRLVLDKKNSSKKYLKIVIPAARVAKTLREIHQAYHNYSIAKTQELISNLFHDIHHFSQAKIIRVFKSCKECNIPQNAEYSSQTDSFTKKYQDAPGEKRCHEITHSYTFSSESGGGRKGTREAVEKNTRGSFADKIKSTEKLKHNNRSGRHDRSANNSRHSQHDMISKDSSKNFRDSRDKSYMDHDSVKREHDISKQSLITSREVVSPKSAIDLKNIQTNPLKKTAEGGQIKGSSKIADKDNPDNVASRGAPKNEGNKSGSGKTMVNTKTQPTAAKNADVAPCTSNAPSNQSLAVEKTKTEDFKLRVRRAQMEVEELQGHIRSLEQDPGKTGEFLLKAGMLCRRITTDGKTGVKIVVTQSNLLDMIYIVHTMAPVHAPFQKTVSVFNKHFTSIEGVENAVNQILLKCESC